jgi:gag-polyprotein putative aspartyl protease
MPIIHGSPANMEVLGPQIHLHVAVQAADAIARQQNGQTIPTPVPLVALIDTGATGSSIPAATAQALGLNPTGVTQIVTPSTAPGDPPIMRATYAVRFVFPGGTAMETVAMESELAGQGIDCLIGRDVLKVAVLIYVGYTNTYTLTF